jgi:hypothetical protein
MVEGKAKDRGCAYGKRFREEIHDFLDKEIYRAFVGQPFVKEQMLRYAADCGNVVRDGRPLIAEEFEGIADGAGLAFAEIMLINLHEEFYHRKQLPQHGHCTAVAVGPSDTGNQRTMSARRGTGCRASRESPE